MKLPDVQAYIKCRDNKGVIIDKHDQEVYISVFVSGAHASCFMTRGETFELIEALQNILNATE